MQRRAKNWSAARDHEQRLCALAAETVPPQIEVISIAAEITSITAVASQPSARSKPRAANFAMMSGRHTIFTITNITGTATTPLSTALQ